MQRIFGGQDPDKGKKPHPQKPKAGHPRLVAAAVHRN